MLGTPTLGVQMEGQICGLSPSTFKSWSRWHEGSVCGLAIARRLMENSERQRNVAPASVTAQAVAKEPLTATQREERGLCP